MVIFKKIYFPFFLLLIGFLLTSWNFPKRNGLKSNETVFSHSASGFDFSLNFIWPTDASKVVTNQFGAYRKTHFHEGIDISTNRRTGYDVYAVRSGYVSRIRVSPNGYGLQVTMKHVDGSSASFSHLSRFAERIERYVKKEQYKAGGYELDIVLDSGLMYYNQGDIIAFTGETGAGPPHLHFEVYDNSMNPVNPLLIEAYQINESTPPIIGRLLLQPLTVSSRIDGQRKSKRFSTKKKPNSEYVITTPIHIAGDIGMEVFTEDVSDSERRLSGIYTLQLFLDDTLLYEAQYNSLRNNGAKEIALHYNYPLMRNEGAKFQKLYIEEGNPLPLYQSPQILNGIIRSDKITPGEHTFKIVSTDLAGNYATLSGKLVSNHIPEITNATFTGKNISFSLNNENVVKEIQLSTKFNGSVWKTKSIKLFSRSMSIPFTRSNGDVVRLVATNKYGTSSFPAFIFLKPVSVSSPTIKIEKQMKGGEMEFTIRANSAFTKQPSIGIREGAVDRQIMLNALDVNEYQGSYAPSTNFIGERTLEVSGEVGGKFVQSSESFFLIPIDPHQSGEIFSSDRNMKITFEKNSVYKPLFLSYAEKGNGEMKIYSVYPNDVMLKKGVSVSLYYPKEINPKYLGFYWSDGVKWKFLSSKLDTTKLSVTALLTRTFGEVALFSDSIRPTIKHFKIKGNSAPSVQFAVRDDMSGINLNDAKLFVDGALVIPTVSEGGIYSAYLEGLSSGKHLVRLTVKDRAGNSTTEEQPVRIP
ncbi:MAG: M23 family metallopeptidase [Ignavibacteriales bacterium]|nr:M23 family metallopeptidase [Ignavibacteriales bacterium]